jgi:hypothetical protein
MDWLERITVNPEQCGGRPCVRGMRIRVVDVLQLLAAGLTQEQILRRCPTWSLRIYRRVSSTLSADCSVLPLRYTPM